MLATIPAGLVEGVSQRPARKVRPLPKVGEFVRFADPTTETPVVRLTNPSTTSLLPAPTKRFVSVKDRFLIFSSDRMGKTAPFRLDLRTGQLSLLTQPAELCPQSLCLDQQERELFFIDGSTLKTVSLANKKLKVLSEDVSAFSAGRSESELVVVRRERLELLNIDAPPLAEEVAPWCLVRPGGEGCAFGREGPSGEQEFWYAPFPKLAGTKPILLAKGRITNPCWSPNGASLLFLRDVPGRGTYLSEIHEAFPESGVEQRVARTSQFAAFSPNADGSVFVGASRSKAQPTVILLLRSTQREFTLCEHRASRPASVSPVFSPDSRRVYFESDRQGKPALYSVNVELLVEPTVAAA